MRLLFILQGKARWLCAMCSLLPPSTFHLSMTTFKPTQSPSIKILWPLPIRFPILLTNIFKSYPLLFPLWLCPQPILSQNILNKPTHLLVYSGFASNASTIHQLMVLRCLLREKKRTSTLARIASPILGTMTQVGWKFQFLHFRFLSLIACVN